MDIAELSGRIDTRLLASLTSRGLQTLRPSQEKSILAGVLDGKNVLVCTPTASGKTLVAELACLGHVLAGKKAIYIVPLKSLAVEKYKEFKKHYGHLCKIALSIGDKDSADEGLHAFDLIITTSEKLDAVMRFRPRWLLTLGCVVIDEIHLLNDATRGPTLEIVITLLRTLVSSVQLVCLSATIGNAQELASWLEAQLVVDTWRPIELQQGIYVDGEITFYKS